MAPSRWATSCLNRGRCRHPGGGSGRVERPAQQPNRLGAGAVARHLGIRVMVLSGMLTAFPADFASPVQGASGPGHDRGAGTTISTTHQVLKHNRDAIMALPGVLGTGLSLCQGKPCIKVFVTERMSETERELERLLRGHPFVIEESGRFEALPARE